MFIFGFGHRTLKKYGKIISPCLTCSKGQSNIDFIRVTIWFTLFFVPIIPISKKYLLICSHCKDVEEVDKKTFFDYLNNTIKKDSFGSENKNNQTVWYGKTETQINYLKEMERLKKERERIINEN
ncbi:zinc ribbon family protein [Natranaerovirga hydrolytica]|uniref:Zinc ribbon family protein n=1 Tax=Natranaerovirga hydrolytica TaxID=680378 RepID=A0A4R1MSJ0_9FIRM|nr:zinc-ribbon domain-containing protein [Natranaerovirga hydrolytica]TCK92893.1 zinc ribbon family protein [Natranaerovirga hydrolytica]